MGTIHQLVGTGWRPLDVHRHDRFRGIDIAPDGKIRVAGDDGVCLLQDGEPHDPCPVEGCGGALLFLHQ